jgi:hypothetical protein
VAARHPLPMEVLRADVSSFNPNLLLISMGSRGSHHRVPNMPSL